MTQQEFQKSWTREASIQPGIMLDVMRVNNLSLQDNKAA